MMYPQDLVHPDTSNTTVECMNAQLGGFDSAQFEPVPSHPERE
jgi:hypothetical protein